MGVIHVTGHSQNTTYKLTPLRYSVYHREGSRFHVPLEFWLHGLFRILPISRPFYSCYRAWERFYFAGFPPDWLRNNQLGLLFHRIARGKSQSCSSSRCSSSAPRLSSFRPTYYPSSGALQAVNRKLFRFPRPPPTRPSWLPRSLWHTSAGYPRRTRS